MVAHAKILFWLLVTAVTSVQLVQIMFGQFRRCSSNGVIECNLRVRKINRTVAALYGNVSMLIDIGDSFMTSYSAYHSTLGNNQYNLYPMKIAPISACTYIRTVWSEYYPYFKPSCPNIAEPGVCPLTAREVLVNDLILDPGLVPPYVPTGLWKLIWRAEDNGTGLYFELEVTFKLFPNGHF